MLEWYRLRWRIEDWHRILKSVCKVEYLGHRTGERIERAVTIKPVIAWRLAAMTLLGRATPELPAAVFFCTPASLPSFVASLPLEIVRLRTIHPPDARSEYVSESPDHPNHPFEVLVPAAAVR